MTKLFVFLIDGLAFGSLYALMAMAMAIIHRTSGVCNFAHGATVMVGSIVMCKFSYFLGFSYWVSLLISIVLCMLLNVAIYFTSIRPIGNVKGKITWIITLIAANALITNIARMWFGADSWPVEYVTLFGKQTVNVGGTTLYIHQFFVIFVTLLLAIVYAALMKYTRYGRAVRAVAFNEDVASLMGIQSRKITLSCYIMSGAIAAFAGVMMAPYTFASYTVADILGMKGFAAAVIGGMGNTVGGFIAGFIIGIIEKLSAQVISGSFKDIVCFALMIIILLITPGGITNGFKKKNED